MIPKRFGDVPLDPPVRILVNRGRYQTALLLEEARKNLDGRIEAETDIRLAREAEDRLGRAIVDPAGNLQDQRIGVSHKLGVLEDERLVRLEAYSRNLENILLSPLLSILIGEASLLL